MQRYFEIRRLVVFLVLTTSIYTKAAVIFAPKTYEATPQTAHYSETLPVGQPGSAYTLKITNGTNSNQRANHLTITLNGVTLLSDSSFENVPSLNLNLSLLNQNTLTFDVHGGNSGRYIIVEIDSYPPVAVMSATPQSGMIPLHVSFSAAGSIDPFGGTITNYSWNFGDGSFPASGILADHTYTAPGTYNAILTVTSSEGLVTSTSQQIFVQPDTQAPFIGISSPHSGDTLTSLIVPVSGTSNERLSVLTVNGSQVPLSADGMSFSGIYASPDDGAQSLVFAATDVYGNTSTTNISVNIELPPELTPPPDPATVAPPLAVGENTSPVASLEFLFTGDDPIQKGVVPGVIDELHVAGIRGKIIASDSSPIKGVKVTALDHSEFGYTISREDGVFDFVFDADGEIILQFEKEGYFKVQRRAEASMQVFGTLDDLVMIQASPVVSTVASNSPVVQVAQGETVTDEDGSRKGTLVVPSQTSAQIVLPNGTVQNLDSLSIRISEFTQGRDAQNRMPAELPANTAYTYAVDISADEAIAVGADLVTFNKPLYYYLDNFIGFPPGAIVPSGFYNYKTGKWEASKNGVVVKILSIQNGMAIIDADGTGTPASVDLMNLIGYNSEEAQKIASLYEVGKSYWRIPIEHLTPWDFNFIFSEVRAQDENGPPTGDTEVPVICGVIPHTDGSKIGVQAQSLGESVPIAGTPFSLNYQSDRMPGNSSQRTYSMKVTGANIDPTLTALILDWKIAGRSFRETLPASPNISRTFIWDGKDAFGRTVGGSAKGELSLSYQYSGEYAYYIYQDSLDYPYYYAFGLNFNGVANILPIDRTTFLVTRKYPFKMSSWSPVGFGGWTLSEQHSYDSIGKNLHLGSGETESASNLPNKVVTYSGGGARAFEGGNGGDKKFATYDYIAGLSSAPDGTVFVGEWLQGSQTSVVRRIDAKTGIISTVAGHGTLQIPFIFDIRAFDSNTFYLVTKDNLSNGNAIYKVQGDLVTRIVGSNPGGGNSDGLPADIINEGPIISVGVDKDGIIYYSTTEKIRRISNGIVQTIAGGGSLALTDGGNALTAAISFPRAITPDSNGGLYFNSSSRIWRVTRDGKLNLVGGGGPKTLCQLQDGDNLRDASLEASFGMACDSSGNLHVSFGSTIMSVQPAGSIKFESGQKQACPGGSRNGEGDGGPAVDAWITIATVNNGAHLFSMDSFGNSYFSNAFNNVYRVRIITPAFEKIIDGSVIASSSGTELFAFDVNGKHLETRTSLTGALKYKFDYNQNGFLAAIHDIDDNITVINRDSNNNPVSIVSPYGVQTNLTVDSDGSLSSVSNQEGDTYSFTYYPGGLIRRFNKPNGNGSTMTYGAGGKLTKDQNDSGGFSELIRSDLGGGTNVTLMSAVGISTSFALAISPLGKNSWNYIDSSGLLTKSEENNYAASINTLPNGTTQQVAVSGDPRLGLPSSYNNSYIRRTPAGLTYIEAKTKAVQNLDLTNVFNFSQLTEITTINGNRTFTSTFNPSSRSWTRTSPEGRVSQTLIDEKEKISQTQTGNLTPAGFGYDEKGRLSTTSQGPRMTSMSYDTQGFVESITDSKNQTKHFTYDNAGRMLSQTLPDNRVVGYSYDRNGNLTGVTPPGRPQHNFLFDLADLLGVYTPPTVASFNPSTTYSYDLDKKLTFINKPGGLTANYVYEQGTGRLSTITTNEGLYQTTYDNVGRVFSMSHLGESMEYSYDGSLLVNTLFKTSGTAYGSVGYAYNNNFQVSTHFVNGQGIAMSYDRDGLLTSVGSEILTYDSNGLLATRSVGGMDFTYGYNEFGELTSFSAKRGTSSFLTYTLVRDDNGKIIGKTETIATGITSTSSYVFDSAQRIRQVFVDGVQRQKNDYDENSNRTSFFSWDPQGQFVGSFGGSYDDQDRLIRFDGFDYLYNDNGDVARSTLTNTPSNFTTFSYDVFGNLRRIFLSAANLTFDYIIDAQNRLIGRKRNGVTTQRLMYDGPKVVAELDGNSQLVSRFVYGSSDHSPDYMFKGGVLYVFVNDHLGGPRYIVRSTDGAIVQTLSYEFFDVYGSNAGGGTFGGTFQPFGFAGGLVNLSTGTIRFGARDYHPGTARWTSKDPILFASGDPNLFGYCMNDPVNFVDPSGLSEIDPSTKPKSALEDVIYRSCKGRQNCIDKMYENIRKSLEERKPNPYGRPGEPDPSSSGGGVRGTRETEDKCG